MSGPLALPQDVADIWRPLTTAEQSRAASLITKAAAILRHACPFNIDERMALEPTDPQYLPSQLVASVVAGIVKRVMVNPDDVVSTSRTTGPYSESKTFAERYSDGGISRDLSVTADDIDRLRPAVGFQLPFTIKTPPPRHPRAGFPEVRPL